MIIIQKIKLFLYLNLLKKIKGLVKKKSAPMP